MRLNVEDWKEFKLTDVFAVKGGFYNKKPEHSSPGDIPFLASTESNNGVTEYYTLSDIQSWDKVGNPDDTLEKKIYSGNCIAVTVNGSVCNAFYQSKDFTCSHDITVLYAINHNLTLTQALFICTIIMGEKYRWSYGRKPHDVKKFGRSIIKLPVDDGGNPDWAFMDSYIKTLKHKPLSSKNRGWGCELPVFGDNMWANFFVGDIFYMYNGKGITQAEIEENPGSMNAIQSGEDNNGVLGKIDRQYCIDQGYTYTDEMCLTVARSGSAGYVSFQAEGCVVGDSAKILILKDEGARTTPIYLFLRTILMANKYKYTYGRKVTEEKYLAEEINLPVKNNKPDWEFMTLYMQNLQYGDKVCFV